MPKADRIALLTLEPDRMIEVHQRRSERAKRLILRVDTARNHVELVLPPRLSEDRAWRFLESKRGWLRDRLSEIPDRVPFVQGQVLPLHGKDHVIRHFPGSIRGRNPVWIAPASEDLAPAAELVPGAPDPRRVSELPAIHISGAESHLARRLTDWLKAEARRTLSDRTREKARRLGRRAIRVSVKDTRSRWGSCSSEGRIAYSWRLILAPDSVLDYVVAHEVSHLVELNHSDRFWRLCEGLTAEMEIARQWLRDHGSRLHRYGDTSC